MGIHGKQDSTVKNDKGIIVSTVNFTTTMTAAKTKELILQKLVRKTKDILGAPKNNRVTWPSKQPVDERVGWF